MNIGHTISTKIIEGFRSIKIIYGLMTSENKQATPYGFDSVPLKNANAVQIKGKRNVTVGYLQKAIDDLKTGESIVFSKNPTTAEIKSTIIARNDGNVEVNGKADNAVRFAKLDLGLGLYATASDTERARVDALINAELGKIAAVLNAEFGPGTYVPTPITPVPVPLDISLSKVETVKLP